MAEENVANDEALIAYHNALSAYRASIEAVVKKFRDICVANFGESVYDSSPQEMNLRCGAIVGNIMKKHGYESDEFKAAAAKYELTIPFWTVIANANDALK